jgi:hypothetical protein
MALASAIATANVETVGNRAMGSLAIARKITSERAGGTMGLIKAGGVGSLWMCCEIMAVELSPRNGTVPVYIS